jgi:hypothetical protein
MRSAFDDPDSPLADVLAANLNRWAIPGAMQLRYRLTTLTTFVINAEAIQDRFDGDALRDTNSISVMPGFEMKPSALVSGRVWSAFASSSRCGRLFLLYRGRSPRWMRRTSSVRRG